MTYQNILILHTTLCLSLRNQIIFASLLITTSILLALGSSSQFTFASNELSNVDSKSATLSSGENNQTQAGFIFIQHALSGSAEQLQEGNLVLTLNNASKTIAFSERPERIVSEIPESVYMDMWSTQKDSFASDPPNTALIVEGNTTENIAVVELLNAMYNDDTKTLQYDIRGLNNTSIDIPTEFDRITLVIDAGDNYCKINPQGCIDPYIY